MRSRSESGEKLSLLLALGQTVPVADSASGRCGASLGVVPQPLAIALRGCARPDSEWADVTVIRWWRWRSEPTSGRCRGSLRRCFRRKSTPPSPWRSTPNTPRDNQRSGDVLQARPASPTDSQSGFVMWMTTASTAFGWIRDTIPTHCRRRSEGLADAVAICAVAAPASGSVVYLYYAQVAGNKPQVMQCQTREVFTTTILPTCEAMLGPAGKATARSRWCAPADLLDRCRGT